MQFYVDGSFDDDKHISSYGVIVVNNNKVIDILYNVCTNEEYLKHRNVYGEVLGTLCAIKYAQINKIKNILRKCKLNLFYIGFDIENKQNIDELGKKQRHPGNQCWSTLGGFECATLKETAI